MQLEIEKKYDLIDHDYKIIKSKCELLEHKEVRDYYLDDADLTLFKNKHRLRLRNGKYELKIKGQVSKDSMTTNIEIDDEELIEEKLSEFNLSTDDVTGVLEIFMDLEKFEYIHNGQEFIIDIQRYKYGERYEIELCCNVDEKIDGSKLIDEFREHLGLVSREQLPTETKPLICAMHENFALYEVMLELKK